MCSATSLWDQWVNDTVIHIVYPRTLRVVMLPTLWPLVAPQVVVLRVVMLPTLWPLVAPQVVVLTWGATNDHKVSILMTFFFVNTLDASKITVKDMVTMVTISLYLITTKHNKTWTICIFLGCISHKPLMTRWCVMEMVDLMISCYGLCLVAPTVPRPLCKLWLFISAPTRNYLH